MADRAFGPGTRLIYYMEIGQVISRAFTSKDTHTPLGDLIVSVTSLDAVSEGNVRRAMGSTALLGISAPSFTYGTDLLLPAETNEQLRKVLRRSRDSEQKGGGESATGGGGSGETQSFGEHCAFLASIEAKHASYASIHIPEVGGDSVVVVVADSGD